MYRKEDIKAVTKAAFYDLLARQLAALLEGERDAVANMANTAALLFDTLDSVNWVGFYRYTGSALLLGPFCGKPACVHIELAKGVCGTSAAKNETLLVPDVHKFAGHIACDAASRSEIVIPIVQNGTLFGVLDIDAPIVGRFDEQDKIGLEKIVKLFIDATTLSERML